MSDTIIDSTLNQPAPMTRYVILTRDDSGYWNVNKANLAARSAEAAIRALKEEGTHVAIPARSWNPVTVTAEVTTTLKLENADPS